MKIYLAGKITGDKDYFDKFFHFQMNLESKGHIPFNPGHLPPGAEYEDYMHICFAMIDICDAVCFISDWEDSPGAVREMAYAKEKGKQIIFANGTTPVKGFTGL